ncbi:acyltransferase [Kribbella capetownensis]|uniref:Acyltransferase n=1 Tax=Kribbella capetownensis TaxID=1572659 RepID=A0A4R0JP87_9ACTN|nr:acyltransferase domain-containing protein [Kribbella capetownensis]TCC49073.1 acyltransferase [Kribbella capetownensis]
MYIGVEEVAGFLGDDPALAMWLGELQRAGGPRDEVDVPVADTGLTHLLRLGVPAQDAAEIVAGLSELQRNPALSWLVRRCAQRTVADMGGFRPGGSWPALPDAWGRYFYVYVFLAVLPHVRAYHQQRGIPDDISWATLAALGSAVESHRQRLGTGGMDAPFWIDLHFRGGIYLLGRLGFNRGDLGFLAPAVQAAGLPAHESDPALGVHAAPTGPLDPVACDASFALATEFFARHFPEETYRLARCGSWILDEQLTEYLPADSNIIRFQRRFHLTPETHDGDADILSRIFQASPDTDLATLPRRTTLQRAVIDHLRAGRHWNIGFGWLEL